MSNENSRPSPPNSAANSVFSNVWRSRWKVPRTAPSGPRNLSAMNREGVCWGSPVEHL